MNANELADKLAGIMDTFYAIEGKELYNDIATMLRQQQAEIEALKKTCLDEITKRVYADQTTKVIEGYWGEAQTEIAALKERMRPCQPLCKPSVCDCRPLNQTYDPKKHGAEE